MLLRQRVKVALLIHRNKHREAAKLRRKRNRSEMKEQNKTPELNEIEITNLSDAEFNILVIRMLRDLTGYGKNIKEEMKATRSEMTQNLQGTISGGKEARIQINNL